MGAPICDRCGKVANPSIMSRFNSDTLCKKCEAKEKAHPKYAEARRIEAEAVRRGDYNFAGIGKPDDL